MKLDPGRPRTIACGDGLAVVLVTYNSAHVLTDALRSLNDHLPAADVIVVDNGSVDDTLDIARRNGVGTIVAGHGNIGYGAAVNRGANAAMREVVLVINPDVVVSGADPQDLDELLKTRPFGLVSCECRHWGRLEAPVKVAWGWRRELAGALLAWFVKPRWFNPRRRPARRGEQGWVSGAAFMFLRDEWERVGGFNEEIFLYYEDFDLSRRYRSCGLPLRGSSAIKVEHRRHEERGAELELVQSWALRSLVQTIAAWEGEVPAVQAAKVTLRALAAYDRVAHLGSLLPIVGRHAARKRENAGAVRAYLTEDAARPTSPAQYGAANQAFRHARAHVRG